MWLGRFFIVLYASIFLIATFHHTDYVLIYIHMISRFMSSTHCCNVVICHKSDPHYTRFETSLSLLQNVNKLGHELVHESLNSALLCLVCISIIFEGYFEIINVSFDLIIFVYLPWIYVFMFDFVVQSIFYVIYIYLCPFLFCSTCYAFLFVYQLAAFAKFHSKINCVYQIFCKTMTKSFYIFCVSYSES